MRKNILKSFIIILFISFILITNISYAAVDIDKILKVYYDEVEFEGKTYYRRKDLTSYQDVHISYSKSTQKYTGTNKTAENILYDLINSYTMSLTTEQCEEDKRIKENYNVYISDIYSISEENPYKDGDDIIGLITIFARPINGESKYWKETFSSNELSYNEMTEEYNVNMYYFVRASKNNLGEYEIVYIDLKPENYDEYLENLKNEKGIDLKNLDVEKVLNTKYTDDIEIVPSENTITESAKKNEYNSKQIEEIKIISSKIRYAAIFALIIMIILVVKPRRNNMKK